MSQTVLDRWESRLQNWALWIVRGSARPSQISSIYRDIQVRYRCDSLTPQPLIGEAVVTDALVHRLDEKHRQALVARFVWTGTIAQRSADLGVHPNTLADRVRQAKFRLEDLHQARRPRVAE